jgi:hypothetical protein
MQFGKTARSFFAVTIAGIAFVTACGDGDDNGMDIKDDSVTGGASGTSAGGTSGDAGSPSGGSSGAAGATMGGTGGDAGAGMGGEAGGDAGAGMGGEAGGDAGAGMGGEAGGDTGGTGGGGMAGMAGGGKAGGGAGGMAGGGMSGAGAGGMSGAGAGGMSGAGAGGMSGAGAGGVAGAGAGGMAPTMLYDFENGVQGWGPNTSTSMTQVKDGANSLAVTHGALNGTNVGVEVSFPPVWPGTIITVNAWLPDGLDTSGATYFQMFTNSNDYSNFDVGGNGPRTPQSGAWTTWQYTVPNTFPGGIQVLGFQLGDNPGDPSIPAGTVYIDSITATNIVANCALAAPSVLHDFESALPANTYLVDGGGNVTLSQSPDRFYGGTGANSLKVSFVDLPAPASGESTKRFVYINRPNVYCSQTTTFHIWLPAGSEAMGVQVLSVFNWYTGFHGTGNLTVTRDDWTTGALTIPTTVDHRGIQRVGIEFIYTGTSAFTGDAYIDQVAW